MTVSEGVGLMILLVTSFVLGFFWEMFGLAPVDLWNISSFFRKKSNRSSNGSIRPD